MVISSNQAKKQPSLIVCQIGAREHYAIPRALHQQEKLVHLVTDAWVAPQSILNFLPRSLLTNLRERFHPKLASASIFSFNNSLIRFEIQQKIIKKSDWKTIIARNKWFQERSIKILDKLLPQLPSSITLFAYSYAALDLFKFAQKQGWQTILGQIDPGIYEEQLVSKERDRYPQYASTWQPAPTEYWVNWQQECSLADRIIVNSRWSSQALQKTGISTDKIKIVPLAYKPPEESSNFTRIYPSSFSHNRPLRVLFLGQIILRKGVAKIFEAIDLLSNEPIEFWLVGSIKINIPRHIQNNHKIKLFGAVSRSQTAHYYQQADVFLFPTLSDGFGLTQLEAQAWQLPIIASKFCGAVVKNQINGLILSDVTGESIANSLTFCLNNPDLLTKFSQEYFKILSDYNLPILGEQLQLLNQNYI
ncbi:MAG: glycosyltransferase family 4 protein [Xenococcaceae cyanobacterium]